MSLPQRVQALYNGSDILRTLPRTELSEFNVSYLRYMASPEQVDAASLLTIYLGIDYFREQLKTATEPPPDPHAKVKGVPVLDYVEETLRLFELAEGM